MATARPSVLLSTVESAAERKDSADVRESQTKGRGIVCKPYHRQEQVFYESVIKSHPELIVFLPAYFGVIEAQYAPWQTASTAADCEQPTSLGWRVCKDTAPLSASAEQESSLATKLPYTTFSIPGSPSVSRRSTLSHDAWPEPLSAASSPSISVNTSPCSKAARWAAVSASGAPQTPTSNEYAFHPWSLKLYQKIRNRKEPHAPLSPDTTSVIREDLSAASLLVSDGALAQVATESACALPALLHVRSLQKFILLEDLTDGMRLPCILDLKMGRRHYGLGANAQKKARQHAKTASTTSLPLALRLCGMQVYKLSMNKYTFISKYEGRRLSVGQLRACLVHFLDNGKDVYVRLIPPLLGKLYQLQCLVAQSLTHFRLYASSLLLLYDGFVDGPDGVPGEIDIRIIDFAHCYAEDSDELYLAADNEYCSGPDTDYLDGLANLMAILEEIFHSYSSSLNERVL